MNNDLPDTIYPTFRHRITARFMGLFFRLLYHPLAWTYDLVAASVSLGRWKRWVMAALDLVEGPRVLELGYGPGHLQAQLNTSGLRTFGLDESAQMARQAHSRLKRKKLAARLSRGLAQYLPYASNSFDSVVATFPTQYIVDPATLSEIWRVLRPGGRLVVLFAAWITGQSLPERALSLLFRTTGQVPKAVENDEPFTNPFQNAGFQAQARYVNIEGGRLLFVVAHKRN